MGTDRKMTLSMKTIHRRIEKLLSAYIFGELSEKKSAQVKQHLAQCDDCARALKREEALHRSLAGTLAHRTIDPSHDIAGAVLAKIREQESRESVADRISKTFDMRFRPAAAYALAASIGLAVGILPLFTFFSPAASVAETQADPLAVEYLLDGPPQSLTSFYLDGEMSNE